MRVTRQSLKSLKPKIKGREVLGKKKVYPPDPRMKHYDERNDNSMRNKIQILTLSGDYIDLDTWQKKYGLLVGSAKIGKYFSYDERIFTANLKDYGELIVCEPLMIVLDEFRVLTNGPVSLNSFNRSEERQAALKLEYARAATTSPHVAKMAADIDTTNDGETLNAVEFLQAAAKNKNVKIRIGYKDYMKDGKTFVHVDVTPEYYAKGKPWHSHPHPEPWEREARW